MITIGKYNFPDNCPEECPQRFQPFYQGNLCSRCPIFNCKKTDDGFSLLEPNDYREDWAEAFHIWMFKDNFKGIPSLSFT